MRESASLIFGVLLFLLRLFLLRVRVRTVGEDGAQAIRQDNLERSHCRVDNGHYY